MHTCTYVGIGVLLVSLAIGVIIYLMVAQEELKLNEEYIYDNLSDDSKVQCTLRIDSLPSSHATLITFMKVPTVTTDVTGAQAAQAAQAAQVCTVQVKDSNLFINSTSKSIHNLAKDVKANQDITLTFKLKDNECSCKGSSTVKGYLPDGKVKMSLGHKDAKMAVLTKLVIDGKEVKLSTLKKKKDAD
jgi:hypothetical protein